MTVFARALALAAAAPATALAAGADAGPGAMQSLWQTTLGLALVLALIWAAAWAIRRVSPTAARPNSLLRHVATLAVGQRERVVVVEVGDEWLVLGVTANSVSALTSLPRGVLPGAPAAPAFARLFARAKERPSEP
jgi:flagellar protein FliO/FliZ